MDDDILVVSCPAVIPIQIFNWVSPDILKALVPGCKQLIICLEPGTTKFVKHIREKWTDPTILYVDVNSVCETLETLSHLDFCIAAQNRNSVRDHVNAWLSLSKTNTGVQDSVRCSMLFGEEKPQPSQEAEYDIVLEELCDFT